MKTIDTRKAGSDDWDKYCNQILADNLKEARIQKKITQQKAADYLGVTNATISRYENGSRNVGSRDLKKLSKLYGISVRCLQGWTTTEGEQQLVALKSKDPELIEQVFGLPTGSVLIPNEDEEYKIRQQVVESNSNQNSFRNLPKYRLLAAFNRMNEKGQETAADRVEELSKIPDYQKPDEN